MTTPEWGAALQEWIGWGGGVDIYNSTIYLAARALAKLQTMGRLAHACSTKPVCSHTHLTECVLLVKRQDN